MSVNSILSEKKVKYSRRKTRIILGDRNEQPKIITYNQEDKKDHPQIDSAPGRQIVPQKEENSKEQNQKRVINKKKQNSLKMNFSIIQENLNESDEQKKFDSNRQSASSNSKNIDLIGEDQNSQFIEKQQFLTEDRYLTISQKINLAELKNNKEKNQNSFFEEKIENIDDKQMAIIQDQIQEKNKQKFNQQESFTKIESQNDEKAPIRSIQNLVNIQRVKSKRTIVRVNIFSHYKIVSSVEKISNKLQFQDNIELQQKISQKKQEQLELQKQIDQKKKDKSDEYKSSESLERGDESQSESTNIIWFNRQQKINKRKFKKQNNPPIIEEQNDNTEEDFKNDQRSADFKKQFDQRNIQDRNDFKKQSNQQEESHKNDTSYGNSEIQKRDEIKIKNSSSDQEGNNHSFNQKESDFYNNSKNNDLKICNKPHDEEENIDLNQNIMFQQPQRETFQEQNNRDQNSDVDNQKNYVKQEDFSQEDSQQGEIEEIPNDLIKQTEYIENNFKKAEPKIIESGVNEEIDDIEEVFSSETDQESLENLSRVESQVESIDLNDKFFKQKESLSSKKRQGVQNNDRNSVSPQKSFKKKQNNSKSEEERKSMNEQQSERNGANQEIKRQKKSLNNFSKKSPRNSTISNNSRSSRINRESIKSDHRNPPERISRQTKSANKKNKSPSLSNKDRNSEKSYTSQKKRKKQQKKCKEKKRAQHEQEEVQLNQNIQDMSQSQKQQVNQQFNQGSSNIEGNQKKSTKKQKPKKLKQNESIVQNTDQEKYRKKVKILMEEDEKQKQLEKQMRELIGTGQRSLSNKKIILSQKGSNKKKSFIGARNSLLNKNSFAGNELLSRDSSQVSGQSSPFKNNLKSKTPDRTFNYNNQLLSPSEVRESKKNLVNQSFEIPKEVDTQSQEGIDQENILIEQERESARRSVEQNRTPTFDEMKDSQASIHKNQIQDVADIPNDQRKVKTLKVIYGSPLPKNTFKKKEHQREIVEQTDSQSVEDKLKNRYAEYNRKQVINTFGINQWSKRKPDKLDKIAEEFPQDPEEKELSKKVTQYHITFKTKCKKEDLEQVDQDILLNQINYFNQENRESSFERIQQLNDRKPSSFIKPQDQFFQQNQRQDQPNNLKENPFLQFQSNQEVKKPAMKEESKGIGIQALPYDREQYRYSCQQRESPQLLQDSLKLYEISMSQKQERKKEMQNQSVFPKKSFLKNNRFSQ